MASSAGGPSGADREAMYRHALDKAMAMGVPLFVSGNPVDVMAQQRGLTVHRGLTKVHVHRGVTGMHHSEGLGNYWMNWPGLTGHNYGRCKVQGDPDETALDFDFTVVMPEGWQPAPA